MLSSYSAPAAAGRLCTPSPVLSTSSELPFLGIGERESRKYTNGVLAGRTFGGVGGGVLGSGQPRHGVNPSDLWVVRNSASIHSVIGRSAPSIEVDPLVVELRDGLLMDHTVTL